MPHYSVQPRSFSIEAETPEAAAKLVQEIIARADLTEYDVVPENELRAALEFYADPEAYWAIFIVPDRPSGLFADDVGCVLMDGEHDHRHGRAARKALGDEWWGTGPCEEMLAQIKKENPE